MKTLGRSKMIARGVRMVTAFCLAVWGISALADTRLTAIEFSSLPGDKTEIRMSFDGQPPAPTGYTIEQPARIVLDMPGVSSGLADKHHNLGVGNARKVSVISTPDRTRAIVNLTQLVSYDTEIRGNTLYLLVGADAGSGMPQPSAAESAMDVAASSRAAAGVDSSIENVDFRRGEQGEGRVVIQMSNPKAPVNVVSDGGKIKVEIRNTRLPANLQRRLDVTDFATPVQIVDALQQGDHVLLTVAASGNYDYLSYQADNKLSIDVTPLTEEEVERRDDIFKYSGEKLSLNFQDIEVRSCASAHRRFHRSQPGCQRYGFRAYHAATEERAVGSGAGTHSEDEGSRSAPGG